jgi:RecB family endonuclease NucS
VEGGRIDITAEDKEGRPVAVELKAATAKSDSIVQILAYMSSLSEEERKPVRGILVAGNFDKRALLAARSVPNLELKQYSVGFSFKDR